MSANPWAQDGPNADLHWRREYLALKAEVFRLRLRLESISRVAPPGSAAWTMAWDALHIDGKVCD